MDKAILDTDILNEVLKRRNPTVTQRAAIYMLEHGQISLSAMSRFEITRGLRHRGAVKLLISFEKFCSRSLLFPIGDAVLDRAADLWVVGRKGGYPHRDADLIIAATALEQERKLVTGNTAHFQWVPGLRIENWR